MQLNERPRDCEGEFNDSRELTEVRVEKEEESTLWQGCWELPSESIDVQLSEHSRELETELAS